MKYKIAVYSNKNAFRCLCLKAFFDVDYSITGDIRADVDIYTRKKQI